MNNFWELWAIEAQTIGHPNFVEEFFRKKGFGFPLKIRSLETDRSGRETGILPEDLGEDEEKIRRIRRAMRRLGYL